MVFGLTSCGGGGGSGTGGEPFGLDARETVTTLTFPDTSPPAALVRVEAFPLLTFDSPVFLTSPPDGTDRICVVERAGRIRIYPNSETANSTDVFLDIRSRVNAGGEEGLLGLAFDPDYTDNGFFYVHYSAASPRRSVIARFQVSAADPDAADASSERILLQVPQPFGNHNGGMLAFGPDGKLYASLGDGGSGGDPQQNGQDPTTLLGSVLRLEPEDNGTYSVPVDNPFSSQGGGLREEVYAFGLRHPWRFSFDRQTGDLWLGDVGQGAREEVNVVRSGDNLGWRFFEGNAEFNNPGDEDPADFRGPILDYGRALGTAVIGGYVYRGPTVPTMVGTYIYGDNGSGRVWALRHDQFELISNTQVATVPQLSAFGEDQSGELYAVALSGTIYRFQEENGGEPPADFPQLLSETGIFADTAALETNAGLIEYDVNVPLWSDHAVKRRWIALPGESRIGFDATGAWSFPVGTVFVKHFELELRIGDLDSRHRLETRVLLHEPAGWAGYTYRWTPEQTDAVLLDDAETELLTVEDPTAEGGFRTQEWHYPSRSQCLSCHTTVAGHVLGVRTRQLNRDFDFPATPDNQLRAWNHIGLFAQDIGNATLYDAFAALADGGADLATRARAYLSVNCAMCHQPNGPTPVALDLRFDVAPEFMNAFDVLPTAGDLGLPGARIIAPGSKEASVLYERLLRLDGARMPNLASTEVDAEAAEVVGAWIDGS